MGKTSSGVTQPQGHRRPRRDLPRTASLLIPRARRGSGAVPDPPQQDRYVRNPFLSGRRPAAASPGPGMPCLQVSREINTLACPSIPARLGPGEPAAEPASFGPTGSMVDVGSAHATPAPAARTVHPPSPCRLSRTPPNATLGVVPSCVGPPAGGSSRLPPAPSPRTAGEDRRHASFAGLFG